MSRSDRPPKLTYIQTWMRAFGSLAPLATAASMWLVFMCVLPALRAYKPTYSQADLWFIGWLVSVFCLWFTLLWNLGYAALNIVDFHSAVLPKTRWIALVVSVIMVAISVMVLIVTSKSIGGIRVTAWQDNIQLTFPHLKLWSDYLDAGAGIVLCAMIYSLICLASAWQPLTAKDVAFRISRFQVSLYSCAALLIFELLEMFTQYSWGIAAYTCALPGIDTCAQPTDKLLIRVLVLSAALLSSLLLFAIYFPVSALQSGWRDELLTHAVAKDPSLDETKWLQTNGLSIAPWKSAIAMFTPLVTGATTYILKHFIGQ